MWMASSFRPCCMITENCIVQWKMKQMLSCMVSVCPSYLACTLPSLQFLCNFCHCHPCTCSFCHFWHCHPYIITPTSSSISSCFLIPAGTHKYHKAAPRNVQHRIISNVPTTAAMLFLHLDDSYITAATEVHRCTTTTVCSFFNWSMTERSKFLALLHGTYGHLTPVHVLFCCAIVHKKRMSFLQATFIHYCLFVFT